MELVEYLDKVIQFENDQTTMSVDDFRKIVKEIPEYLKGTFKIRFNKLEFIEIEDEAIIDNIPF